MDLQKTLPGIKAQARIRIYVNRGLEPVAAHRVHATRCGAWLRRTAREDWQIKCSAVRVRARVSDVFSLFFFRVQMCLGCIYGLTVPFRTLLEDVPLVLESSCCVALTLRQSRAGSASRDGVARAASAAGSAAPRGAALPRPPTGSRARGEPLASIDIRNDSVVYMYFRRLKWQGRRSDAKSLLDVLWRCRR